MPLNGAALSPLVNGLIFTAWTAFISRPNVLNVPGFWNGWRKANGIRPSFRMDGLP